MKKTRKFLALTIALAMLAMMFPMTVLASGLEEEHEGGGGTLVPSVTYNQKIQATLPTSDGFAFVVDPQGLYYLSDEEIKALVVEPGDPGLRRLGEIGITKPCDEPDCEVHEKGDEDEDCNEETGWKLLDTAGQIIFSPYSPWFRNMSNFDIALAIDFAFTDGDDDEDVIAVATPALVGAVPATAAVFIGATFSATNVAVEPTDFAGAVTLPILADSQEPLFILNAANYTDETTITRDDDIITAISVKMREVLASGATGHGTQFMLSGRCNPAANWEAIEKNAALNLGIKVLFELTVPRADAAPLDSVWSFTPANLLALGAGDPIPGAYGLVETDELEAADFVILSPALEADFEVKMGFIGGLPITQTARDWNATIGVNNDIPFNSDGKTITSAVIPSLGSFSVLAEFSLPNASTLRWTAPTAWSSQAGNTLAIVITLSDASTYTLNATIPS